MLCILMILSETRNNQSFTNHGHCQILFLFCFEFNLLIHVQCNCPEKAKHFFFVKCICHTEQTIRFQH